MKNFLLITLSAIVTVLAVSFLSHKEVYGGVPIANEYAATTTDSGWGKNCKDTLVDLKVLGSVLVTLTSNAPLYIYDATTTGPHSDHATTSIALFKTTTAGEYPFDVRVKRGVCVVAGESTVGVASTTITTRP